ncbi:Oxygen-insensitive NAD(P)H nitroreductase [Fulvivirga imtechensis AK7]|uniref:Oxygen-insensitive NAD(P)H nitroreductase n=1 Tax=Fulvivirga imtechensis AK7 TaxID=1237149 RepID=L8JPM9_9BACT|nr:NAD(P)H-dependent oxidoreductase [Fulvivirga imtechensis]ELR69469.1 Oxygen-insensitive NAD(P)H nitroreductase [Fulvivirga imtechensis AK7]
MELIKNLRWRYATKKFDPHKKVEQEQLEKIKEAIRLSASSYGLQPYKVLIVEDHETRKILKNASWGQAQVTDASHLIVFCGYSDITNEIIEDFIRITAQVRGQSPDNIRRYGDFIKGKLAEKTDEERQEWAAKQTYLALGNLLAICAELKIDACPMEGFDANEYNKILQLSERNLNAVVAAAIGYRSEDDHAQRERKVRKPSELLFEVK